MMSFNNFEYVYLIECYEQLETRYKIGRSKNPEERLKNLQTGSSNFNYKLEILHKYKTRYSSKLEKILHNYFSPYRGKGEWFLLENEHIQNFLTICNKCEEDFLFIEKNSTLYESDFISDKKKSLNI